MYNELNSEKVYVWFDIESLLPGQNWEIEIKNTIYKSDYVIFLLSSNCVDKRGYFQKEMRLAIEVSHTIPESDIYIIPIRIDNCDIPTPLTPIHCVDFFLNWDEGFFKLLKAIGIFPESEINKLSKNECISKISIYPRGYSVNEYLPENIYEHHRSSFRFKGTSIASCVISIIVFELGKDCWRRSDVGGKVTIIIIITAFGILGIIGIITEKTVICPNCKKKRINPKVGKYRCSDCKCKFVVYKNEDRLIAEKIKA